MAEPEAWRVCWHQTTASRMPVNAVHRQDRRHVEKQHQRDRARNAGERVGGEQYQQSTSGGGTYWTLWPANSQQWAFNTNVLFSFNPDTSGDDFYFDPTTFLFISSDHFENNGQTITVPALGPSYSWKSGSMFGYIDSEPFWTTSKGFSDAKKDNKANLAGRVLDFVLE